MAAKLGGQTVKKEEKKMKNTVNLYSPYFWEERGDPAFTGTVVIASCRFRTVEEAEKYGKEIFGEHYAGVHQVAFSNEDDLPF